MKKTLLTLACAAAMGGTMNAQVCERYEMSNFHKMSENGNWLVENNNGTLRIYNRITKAEVYLESLANEYAVGLGNSVLNDGTICISYGTKGVALLKDTIVTNLEVGRPTTPDEVFTMSIANGATSDGKRIVGVLEAPDANVESDEIMASPVLWEKNDKGEYKIKTLPHPDKDFTGRVPQYITAVDIADDGKTIAGQIQDASGFYTTPIIWKENAEGKWTYTTPGTELIYDASKLSQLPKLPAEPKEPIAEHYMSKADSVAFVKAFEDYNEKYALAQLGEIPWSEVPERPEKSNFISDKSKADAYADALMEFYEKDEQYWKEFEIFDGILQSITTGSVYMFNNVGLSRNGKYMFTSIQKNELQDPENPWSSKIVTTPYRFTLTDEKDSYESIAGLKDHLGVSVANNGLLVALAPPLAYTRTAYISLPGKPAQTFVDYMASEKQDSVVKFLKDNFSYTVNVEVGVDSMGAPIYEQVNDSTITGTLAVNGEGNRFVSFIYDQMTNPESANYVTYFIDLTKNAGPSAIENVVNKENAGEVLRREYYNLQGQRIAQPTKGIYLEKIITTNGVYTKKVLK